MNATAAMMIGTRIPTIEPWPSQMTASWLSM